MYKVLISQYTELPLLSLLVLLLKFILFCVLSKPDVRAGNYDLQQSARKTWSRKCSSTSMHCIEWKPILGLNIINHFSNMMK